MGIIRWLFGTKMSKGKQELPFYICLQCRKHFTKSELERHYEKTAKEAIWIARRRAKEGTGITSITWTGVMHTFDETNRAWCPKCVPSADAMPGPGRTVLYDEFLARDAELAPRVREVLERDGRILAIVYYQEQTGAGVEAATAYVDNLDATCLALRKYGYT